MTIFVTPFLTRTLRVEFQTSHTVYWSYFKAMVCFDIFSCFMYMTHLNGDFPVNFRN